MANPREEKPVLHTKKHLARLERERRQTNIILFSFIGLLVVVVGLIGYAILYNDYLQARQPVAKIGNVNISVSEWQARVRLQIQTLQNQYSLYQQYGQMFGMDYSQELQQIQTQLGDSTSLGESVLDQMIDEELVRQEAAKRGITVSNAEVDAEIQGAYNFYPNGSPTPTVTPTTVTFPTLSPQTLALVTITPTPTLVPPPSDTPTNTPLGSALTITGTPPSSATVMAAAIGSPTATFNGRPNRYAISNLHALYSSRL